MAFDSLSAFIAMEGHGPYVWTCYGVFFLFLFGMAQASIRQRRNLVRRQQQEQKMGTVRQQAEAEMRLVGGAFQRVSISQNESSSKP